MHDVEYYPRWRTRRGKPLLVSQLEFLKFGPSFEYEGQQYECQYWKCKLSDGKIRVLKFREEKGDDSETSNIENYNVVIDDDFNPIMNTLEEIETRTRQDNHLLEIEVEKKKELLNLLQGFQNEGIRLYRRLLSKPSLSLLNEWRRWKNENPQKHEEFKEILCQLKSMI